MKNLPGRYTPRGAIAAVLAVLAAGAQAQAADAPATGLADSAQAIHQEIIFTASCAQVYAALTETARFNAVTLLSDGKELLAAPGARPTQISPEVGGSFALFGGYITGRNLEMLPGQLLVQAWRTGSWAPGEYSVARFALTGSGAGCRLVLDHRGFPDGAGAHLARGWYEHYWEPMRQLLGGS